MDAGFFTFWLNRQGNASILPSQALSTANILDRMGNGDLISVMLHGKGEVSLKALDLLKERFEDELNFMNNQWHQSEEDNACRDWD